MKSIAVRTIRVRRLAGVLRSALVTLGLPHRAEAQVNVWTTNGPEGGNILALAVDPRTPTTVYAGTDGGGAVSAQHITSGDGYVEFTVPFTTRQAFAGLSTGDLDTSRWDIDFALKFVAGGVVEVRENNLYQAAETTFAANDIFRVAVAGGQVRYSKNGVVFYTSAKPPLYRLLLDTSLQDLNVRIENALIFGTF